MDMDNIPKDLRPDGAGRELWAWLHAECEGIESCLPLVAELCRVADRLQEVRQKLALQGVSVSGIRGRSVRNPLLDTEVKFSKQYQTLWRALGLQDKPDEMPVTRPTGMRSSGERLWQD